MRTAFYTVALGAALLLTASTASVRAEDRDAQSISSPCARVLRLARDTFGHVSRRT